MKAIEFNIGDIVKHESYGVCQVVGRKSTNSVVESIDVKSDSGTFTVPCENFHEWSLVNEPAKDGRQKGKAREFKVGQRAWSVTNGWGTLVAFQNSVYPIMHHGTTYTIDGKVLLSDLRPTLFHNEVPESEWPNPEPPPEPLPELEVDAKIWCKNYGQTNWEPKHFNKWAAVDGVWVWSQGKTSFTGTGSCLYTFWKLDDGRTNCPNEKGAK